MQESGTVSQLLCHSYYFCMNYMFLNNAASREVVVPNSRIDRMKLYPKAFGLS
jgi:hypothetical protein